MKKKILTLGLALSLMLSGGLAMAGCEQDKDNMHTHDYAKSVIEYEVREDEVYSFVRCDCGKKENETKVENAVIATPETAQEILDSNINGKVVVFDEGVYGTLQLRPTRQTLSAVYEYNKSDDWDLSSPLDVEALKANNFETLQGNNYIYHYVREFSNITFAGTENAVFKGVFSSQSKEYLIGHRDNVYTGVAETNDATDVIRNLTYSYSSGGSAPFRFVDHNKIDDMSFVNMKFEGDKGRIYFYNYFNDKVKNLTFNNCTFTTDKVWQGKDNLLGCGSIYLDYQSTVASKSVEYENIVVKNIKADGHYHGVALLNCKNAIIENNEFKNNTYGIVVQGQAEAGPTGMIFIQNNTVENCLGFSGTGERGIRMGSLDNAYVVVRNNTFIDSVDADNEMLKTDNSTQSTYLFENNTHNGVELKDTKGSLNGTRWIYDIDLQEQY